MPRRCGLVLCLILAALPISEAAQSQPVLSLRDQDIVASDRIVSAEYVGRDMRLAPSYCDGALARYLVLTVHKGLRFTDVITVRHAFHDKTPCADVHGWKFSEAMLPPIGSRWLLFLRRGLDLEDYLTYHGTVGRWPLSDVNLAKLKRILERAPRREDPELQALVSTLVYCPEQTCLSPSVREKMERLLKLLGEPDRSKLLGLAACNLKDLPLINESYAKADPSGRKLIEYSCRRSHITRHGTVFNLSD